MVIISKNGCTEWCRIQNIKLLEYYIMNISVFAFTTELCTLNIPAMIDHVLFNVQVQLLLFYDMIISCVCFYNDNAINNAAPSQSRAIPRAYKLISLFRRGEGGPLA